MRRKDREMDRKFALEVIDDSDYGSMALYDKDLGIYSIPLSFVRIKDSLYFHTANEGKKIKFLEANNDVSISFVSFNKIPNLYKKETLEEYSKSIEKFKKISSNIFTTEYKSAIVYGTVSEVKRKEEKIKILIEISKKYVPEKIKYADIAARGSLSRVRIFKVKINDITGKRKKYDDLGVEMKWNRKI